MTTTVAVAGKGGTGKTTFTALLIKLLQSRDSGTVLAIDADPSANLNLALGVELPDTVGRIREDTQTQVSSGRYDASIPKPDFFEYRVTESLVEGRGVDLLAMGRPEGPGCYCAANSILRNVIDRLGDQYDWVVIDNEAGMEHISRQTTRDIDKLFILTDMTMRGLGAAGQIARLVQDLGSRVRDVYLVINRVGDAIPTVMQEEVDRLGLRLIGTLPNDDQVGAFDAVGRPIVQIGEDSLIFQAVAVIARGAGVMRDL